LHYLRRLARLTQTDVAVAVGYSREQITRLEQNQRRPDPTILRALFLPLFRDSAPAPLLERLLDLAQEARASPKSGPARMQPPPTNLPAPLTSFVGREDALSTVCDLVR
jgi:transcriptional regulator with XRE-family HTH domain